MATVEPTGMHVLPATDKRASAGTDAEAARPSAGSVRFVSWA